MQHSFEKVANFRGLPIQALGQQHRELRCINIQTTANRSCIDTLRTGCDQRVALLHQRAGHQFNQVNGHDRNMPAAKDGNSSFALVLQQRKFLRKGIDPIEGWKIQ